MQSSPQRGLDSPRAGNSGRNSAIAEWITPRRDYWVNDGSARMALYERPDHASGSRRVHRGGRQETFFYAKDLPKMPSFRGTPTPQQMSHFSTESEAFKLVRSDSLQPIQQIASHDTPDWFKVSVRQVERDRLVQSDVRSLFLPSLCNILLTFACLSPRIGR